MGEYLVVFENIAKHFQFQADLNLRDMQALPQYNYIRASLMYYPSIFALEEISFMLERAMNNKHRQK